MKRINQPLLKNIQLFFLLLPQGISSFTSTKSFYWGPCLLKGLCLEICERLRNWCEVEGTASSQDKLSPPGGFVFKKQLRGLFLMCLIKQGVFGWRLGDLGGFFQPGDSVALWLQLKPWGCCRAVLALPHSPQVWQQLWMCYLAWWGWTNPRAELQNCLLRGLGLCKNKFQQK